ncbi:MAG: IS66 family insertion sequence element accessory protein TnpA [Pirellulaceae bacterium]|jgi:hypothetical protein
MSRGPDLARRELWRRRLREYERSNLTIADFCDGAGVSTAAFYQWRRKLAVTGPSVGPGKEEGFAKPSPAAASLNFLPVEIMGPGNGSVVELQLPSGIRVLVPSRDQESLRTVLESLTSDRRADRPC